MIPTWLDFDRVRSVLVVGLALGTGLLMQALLSFATEMFLRWRRHAGGPLAWLAGLKPAAIVPSGRRMRAWTIAPVALGGAGALLAWDPLISLFFLALGVGLSYVVEYRVRLARSRRLTRQAEILVVKFRSLFSIENSIFRTLAACAEEMESGELRNAVETCVGLHRTGRSGAADALGPLRALRSHHLDRFAEVIGRSETADRATFEATLGEVEADIVRQLNIEREAGVETAALKGTARALQGAALLAAIAAITLPAWRMYFVSTTANKLLFLLLASTVAGGSIYLEHEVVSIEEGNVA